VFVLNMENSGLAGAPFILYDVTRLGTVKPRQYAIEAGKSLTDKIIMDSSAPNSSVYFYTLLGPNGFVREFEGEISTYCSSFSATLSYSPKTSQVIISLTSSLSSSTLFNISDNAYGFASSSVSVTVDYSQSVTYDVSSSGNWYDFTLVIDSQPSCFRRRFMGRMETGLDSISDPAMAAAIPSYRDTPVPEGMHPPMPESVRNIKRVESPHAKRDKDARFRFEVDEL
jgi:phospholipase C